MPDQLGPLARDAVEGLGVHAQEQAVAHGADAGRARRGGEQADLAHGPAGADPAEQAAGLAVGGLAPGLQQAAGDEAERVAGVALAEQPLAAATHARLQPVEDERRRAGIGRGEVAADRLLEQRLDGCAHGPVVLSG